MDFVDVVVTDDLFENGVELVEYPDPGIEVRTGPFPDIDLPQNFV